MNDDGTDHGISTFDFLYDLDKKICLDLFSETAKANERKQRAFMCGEQMVNSGFIWLG